MVSQVLLVSELVDFARLEDFFNEEFQVTGNYFSFFSDPQVKKVGGDVCNDLLYSSDIRLRNAFFSTIDFKVGKLDMCVKKFLNSAEDYQERVKIYFYDELTLGLKTVPRGRISVIGGGYSGRINSCERKDFVNVFPNWSSRLNQLMPIYVPDHKGLLAKIIPSKFFVRSER
jgi:hypothetical protein